MIVFYVVIILLYANINEENMNVNNVVVKDIVNTINEKTDVFYVMV